jgi:hypothetical protein
VVFTDVGSPASSHTAWSARAARTARAAVRAFGVALDVRAAVDRGPLLTGSLPVQDGTELVALGEAADRVERVLALAGPGETLGGPGVAGTEGLGPGMVLRLGREEILVFRDDGR